jgi:hypothetical protein
MEAEWTLQASRAAGTSRQIVTTRLLSIYECTLSRSVVGAFQSLPLDSYTLNKAGNCNPIWIFMDEDGGDVSRLTRSGNCGLRPLECSVALQMKGNLDFRGFEPQRPSSPFVPPQSVGCCGVSGILATPGDILMDKSRSLFPIGAGKREFLTGWQVGTLPSQINYAWDSPETRDGNAAGCDVTEQVL